MRGKRASRTDRSPRRLLCAFLAVVLVSIGALAGAGAAAAANKAPTVPSSGQPKSVTAEVGQSASFSSTATGTPTPTLQWELSINGGTSWSAITGATASPLTILSVSAFENGYQYRAVFKNIVGEATSKVATLTVTEAPLVTQQPVSVTVEEGQNAVFEATASGLPAATVKWQTSANGGGTWTTVSGATSDKLTILAAKTTLSGHLYRAVFSNGIGEAAMSEAATLTVQQAPLITKQPTPEVTVNEGQSVNLEATASGFPTPTVQWESSSDGGATWSAVAGANAGTFTIAGANVSEDGYEFRASFQNAAGAATSNVTKLTVHSPPVVTQPPLSRTVEVGEEAQFEALASGYPTPTVQWQLSVNAGSSWSNVTGATSDLLVIASPQASESGRQYRAVFTNVSGTATSGPATLTVATTHYNAVAWGQNVFRQLGDGTLNALSDQPVSVSGLTFVSSISAGEHHSLALLADGTVVAWGSNEDGQLGDGTTELRPLPVAVSGLEHVKAISAGANHSLALLSSGTVMAWGDNEFGQLGDGNTLESELPVAVKGLKEVKAISAGANHSLALLSNGTVMAWGDNESGQLGAGGVKSMTPVTVKGLSGVTAVSAGGEFSLGLLTNGTVKAWGSNEVGQLGNSGAEESSNVPVTVGSLTGVTAISAGTEHGLALLSGGTVMAWGEDRYGELGNGTIKTAEETPVAVSGLSGVSAISAGRQYSVALLNSGSVMAWGINHWGTLGDGATGNPSAVPVTVSGLRKVASISAGAFHVLAFGEPIPAVSSVSPNAGPNAGGNQVTINGAGFTGASAVKFGTAEATGVKVESASTITAVVPPGAGVVDVTITTPTGTSPVGPSDHYTYEPPPTVTKLSAKAGSAAGGTTVTVTGTGFAAGAKVKFGGAEAASPTVNSPTSITVVSPAQTAGTVDVTVASTGGASAASTKDHFKYSPTVEGVTPNTGSTLGGTSVTVTGSGYALGSTATTFKFGKGNATAVNCTSATTCTMTAPPQAAGTVDVVATVSKVKSALNAPGDLFTYG